MPGRKNMRIKKVSFTEMVKKQIQEKTKDMVIQVIKKKEVLVRDAEEEEMYGLFCTAREGKSSKLCLGERRGVGKENYYNGPR